MKHITRVLIALLTLALVGAATQQAARHSVRITFEAMVADQPFVCGRSYSGLGITHATLTPEFMRLYISGVSLVAASGKIVPLVLDQDGTWQQRDVAFLSFEGTNNACASGSPQDHHVISGTVPEDTYVGLRFTVGVPQALDHADATIAASPLNLSDMFWSWQDGYKFFRLDGKVRGAGGRSSSFVFHLGSTGCTGNAQAHCTHDNDASIELQRVDLSKPVAIDIARLLASTNLERGGCMMMAGEDCGNELAALGLTGSAQTVFHTK